MEQRSARTRINGAPTRVQPIDTCVAMMWKHFSPTFWRLAVGELRAGMWHYEYNITTMCSAVHTGVWNQHLEHLILPPSIHMERGIGLFESVQGHQ